MMLSLLLRTVGFLLAHTPEPALRLLAAGLGNTVFFCLRRRRRLMLSNLSHAFPENSAGWWRRCPCWCIWGIPSAVTRS